jgi:hypothetical protein
MLEMPNNLGPINGLTILVGLDQAVQGIHEMRKDTYYFFLLTIILLIHNFSLESHKCVIISIEDEEDTNAAC